MFRYEQRVVSKGISFFDQIDVDECRENIFLSPCRLYKCNNTDGAFECYGEYDGRFLIGQF